MSSRVLSWILGSDLTQVMRVEQLAAFLGLPPGTHAKIGNIIGESSNTEAGLIIAKDVDDQDDIDDGDYNNLFFQTIPELTQMTLARYDVEFFQTSSGASTGFNESTGRQPFWEPMRNLAFARDSADAWTITFEYDIVPGEMDWSLLYQDLFEHVHQAELLVTGGQPFFQPTLRYNRVGIL